jgi:hypothetical protein
MSISLQTLKEAVQIKEQISQLEARLSRILGGSVPSVKSTGAAKGARGMSAAGRANIIAAQKARWAKAKAESAPAGKPAKGKRKKKGGLTVEGRARLAATMKARWAARKKAGAPPLNAPKRK